MNTYKIYKLKYLTFYCFTCDKSHSEVICSNKCCVNKKNPTTTKIVFELLSDNDIFDIDTNNLNEDEIIIYENNIIIVLGNNIEQIYMGTSKIFVFSENALSLKYWKEEHKLRVIENENSAYGCVLIENIIGMEYECLKNFLVYLYRKGYNTYYKYESQCLYKCDDCGYNEIVKSPGEFRSCDCYHSNYYEMEDSEDIDYCVERGLVKFVNCKFTNTILIGKYVHYPYEMYSTLFVDIKGGELFGKYKFYEDVSVHMKTRDGLICDVVDNFPKHQN